MLLDIEKLNADCACISLDRATLSRHLDAIVEEAGFGAALTASHPTLLSDLPVYIKPAHLERMAEVIAAVERVVQLPAYQADVLAEAPIIAQHPTLARGVFMGFDFHLGADGPQLIEINTNAGGGLLNAVLAEAQTACCAPVGALLMDDTGTRALAAFLDSFRAEWRAERGDVPLASIAIVDETPEVQYLYPEFVLTQRLFQQHGLSCVIVPPERLTVCEGRLWVDATPIDLVYNRLTDFDLSQPSSAALRSAYLSGSAVVTPHPRAHALYANKANLVRLSDRELLEHWGVDAATIATLLGAIPHTVRVTDDNAAALWSGRDALFFKPMTGFASRAAYRGDKVTRRVWESIVAGGYIAQALVPPSTRAIVLDGERRALKVDIRNYVYNGQVQLVAARLYRGQTTNMRTPGGGFAPVLTPAFWAAGDCCRAGTTDPTCG